MDQVPLITEDNLIGSVASAMLKLKTLNSKKENAQDLKAFVELIKFINTANQENYKQLLYDKNFFVSENVLNNIHQELKRDDLATKIDFPSLIEMLVKNIQNVVPLEIEATTNKLKEILVALLNSKTKSQIYL